jgi:hypothetical protein
MKKEILFMLISAAVIIISCTAKIILSNRDTKIKNFRRLLLIPKINELNIYQEESVFNEAELDSIKNRFLSGFGQS